MAHWKALSKGFPAVPRAGPGRLGSVSMHCEWARVPVVFRLSGRPRVFWRAWLSVVLGEAATGKMGVLLGRCFRGCAECRKILVQAITASSTALQQDRHREPGEPDEFMVTDNNALFERMAQDESDLGLL
eukprot:scaffold3013_cov113-Isochrysis_galbana.AAC.1